MTAWRYQPQLYHNLLFTFVFLYFSWGNWWHAMKDGQKGIRTTQIFFGILGQAPRRLSENKALVRAEQWLSGKF